MKGKTTLSISRAVLLFALVFCGAGLISSRAQEPGSVPEQKQTATQPEHQPGPGAPSWCMKAGKRREKKKMRWRSSSTRRPSGSSRS